MSDSTDDVDWGDPDDWRKPRKQYLNSKQQKMGISRIKNIQAEMRKGEQNSYTSKFGTMYTFACELEDGTKGQVSSMKPAPHALKAGDEVEYTLTPNDDTRFLGKLKIKKTEGSSGGYSGGHSAPSQTQSSSPSDRDISIVTQAILKSVIESGAEPKMWGKLVVYGFTVYDEVVAMRSAPAPVAAPPPAARPTPQTQQPIGKENEDWPDDAPPF
jgi:hypothetical protein